ncbi:MAG TPA: CHAT domain-containing protein [Ktedonobacterales bacterium]
MEYLDFDIVIGPGSGLDYPVLLTSPAGQARGVMRFPFDEAALAGRLKDLQIALLRSGSQQRRRLASPQEQLVQDFGQRLFDALITGEARRLYDASLQLAGLHGRGLRLKLQVRAPQLAALPWEYLFDARSGEYVCLVRATPVIRTLDIAQPIQPFTVQPPLRILGMIASPSDQNALDIAHEQGRLQAALQRLEATGLVRLKWLAGQTWRDLQREIRNGPWHIFHFIGHGGFDPRIDEGVLALTGEDSKSHLLSATDLGRLLANHPSLRLAVLNACEGAHGSTRDVFSSTAAMLARRGIPAVLAMQEEITDYAAIELTRTFYEVLAEGRTVDEAVSEARIAISLSIPNTLEWGTPVLYLRTPDGVLFNLPEQMTTHLSGALPVLPKPVPKPQKAAPQAQPIPSPTQPKRAQGRARRVAVALMGVLRALAGAGIGALAGVSVANYSAVVVVLGVLVGGALGVVVEMAEEAARKGEEQVAILMMRILRVAFGGSLGALIAAALSSGNSPGAVLAGVLIGAGIVFFVGLAEDAARKANSRVMLAIIRSLRVITKGMIGAAGGGAIAFIVGLIQLTLNPPRTPSANSLGQAIGNAIGTALGEAITLIILGILGALIGLLLGFIVGAIVEFSPPGQSPTQADKTLQKSAP